MKKFLIGAAALSLLAGPAFAQHMDRHDNHRPAVQNHGPGGRFTYRGRSFNRVRGPANKLRAAAPIRNFFMAVLL